MPKPFLFTSKLLIAIFVVGFSTVAFAQESLEIDDSTFRRAFVEAENNTAPEDIEFMKAYLNQVNQSGSMGFKGISTRQSPTNRFITCALGKLGFYLAGRLGICYDSNGRKYTLAGASFGYTTGAKASIVMGIVRTQKDIVRGTLYKNLTLSSAPLNLASTIAQVPSTGTFGVGLDTLVGFGENGDSLYLIGPSFGVMVDFSAGGIILN